MMKRPYKKKFIVKVQRPIVTNEEVPKALIYDEDKKVVQMVPLHTVLHLFKNDELKIYLRAELKNDGTLELKQRVSDRAW